MYKRVAVALLFSGCAAVEAEAVIPDNANMRQEAVYVASRDAVPAHADLCSTAYLSELYKRRAKLFKLSRTLEDAIAAQGTMQEKYPIERRLEEIEQTVEVVKLSIESCNP